MPLFGLTPSLIPSPTGTPFEISIDDLNHPLSIEVMRKYEYPGSSITVEQILEPGENYNRYYVSYLSDNLKIYALMTVPDGVKPASGWPVIIFNHGYIPPGEYRTTERYVEYVERIAEDNYIVFRSDYRGHDRSDGEARGAYGYPDYTIDVLNAVASMKTYPDADPDRIGMWGHSMGGYLTLRAMVISEDIKVGVIWAGVVASYPDLVNKWTEPAADTPSGFSGWRTSLAATYGTPAQNPAFWDAISANSYLTDLSGPVQLHHGTGDVEVPVEFSTTLYRQLLVARIPVQLYTYENDNHNISNSFNQAMQRTIQYFNTFLKTNLQ
ncbi:MAG: alpha/beta fold hydrolase [Anaerolineales bacterium]